MTDNEIIKSVECCARINKLGCVRCPFNKYDTDCFRALIGNTYYLLERKKAEIEKLKQSQVIHIDISEQFRKECEYEIKKAKSEAIKEFAEELKKKLIKKMSLAFDRNCYSYKVVISYQTSPETIDDVVKEMTEGENG